MSDHQVAELAIEAVRKDKKACDHVGFYVGFGFEMIQQPSGELMGVCAITCMMCGAVFCPKITVIEAPVQKEETPLLIKPAKS